MNDESRILVIGGNGSLGRELLAVLPRAIGTSRSGGALERLDITVREQVNEVIRRVGPTCVVNTAAMTSVDGCEQDPEAAHRVHVEATTYLADACRAAGSRLIHLSTNYVFDGESGPYAEEDETRPLSVYGQTKRDSEAIVLDLGAAGILVRTAVFYGPEHGKPNFVTWALRELIRGNAIRIVTDEWANPTYVPDLAKAIAGLIEDDTVSGCFHGAGPDYFSRFEMITELCESFDLDSGLVTPVAGAELKQAAKRPKRAGLKTDLIRSTVGDVLRPYRQNLEALRALIGDPEAWASGG